MRAMRGFISKAFALAVEGDICGFSLLSLAPSLSLFLFLFLSADVPRNLSIPVHGVGCILACVVKTEIL